MGEFHFVLIVFVILVGWSLHEAEGTTSGDCQPRSVYTRWGKKDDCGDGSVVYYGTAASSGTAYNGSGANYICLYVPPEADGYDIEGLSDAEHENSAHIHGVKFKIAEGQYRLFSFDNTGTGLDEKDVPCTVCMSSHGSVTVPMYGSNECPPQDWHREYQGYMVSGKEEDISQTSYACADINSLPYGKNAEKQAGETAFGYMAHVQCHCGSLPCPPYEALLELTCAVCTYKPPSAEAEAPASGEPASGEPASGEPAP